MKSFIHDLAWGIMAAALALLARWALDPILGPKYPYATAFVFIALTAWHAGPRAALCMIFLFYPAANYWIVVPRGTLSFNLREDAAGFAINMISAGILIYLAEKARRISSELLEANRRLLTLNAEVACFNEELTATNEELKTANEQVIEMSDRKDHFLSTLSHELRNPMAAIVVVADILKRSKSWDEKTINAVEILERQSRQMKGLLDDLLDKRRIALGKFELKCELTDVRTCVQDGVEGNRGAIKAKKQKISVSTPQTAVYAVVDARRVTQIVSNLVANANKHTGPGTVINVSLKDVHPMIILSVADNGDGISLDLLPHLFEPFHAKKGSPHSGGDGLGIGLTLTKGLVEMHNGQITVSNPPFGTGTVFRVQLPTGLDENTRKVITLTSQKESLSD